jgi:uncharacterized protein (TIGR02466 family)
MIETMTVFPTNVYTIEKPEYIDNLREVCLDYLKDQQINDPYHPCKMTGSFEMDQRIQDFAAFTAITTGNIIADQGYNVNGMGAYFQSMWCQEHHAHSSMDQHTHSNSIMVGFYFIDVPENSSVITFFDPRAGKVATPLEESIPDQITYASNAFHVKPKQGLFVISNSWLPHAFTTHKSDQPLRFIHFNIGLTEHIEENKVEII